ncbi:hypothetical protein LXL04_021241 [Taraxacum kok-saghyz]
MAWIKRISLQTHGSGFSFTKQIEQRHGSMNHLHTSLTLPERRHSSDTSLDLHQLLSTLARRFPCTPDDFHLYIYPPDFKWRCNWFRFHPNFTSDTHRLYLPPLHVAAIPKLSLFISTANIRFPSTHQIENDNTSKRILRLSFHFLQGIDSRFQSKGSVGNIGSSSDAAGLPWAILEVFSSKLGYSRKMSRKEVRKNGTYIFRFSILISIMDFAGFIHSNSIQGLNNRLQEVKVCLFLSSQFKSVHSSNHLAFFAVYNVESTEIIAFYQMSSEKLYILFEQFCDHFHVPSKNSPYMNFISSHSNNIHALDQLRSSKNKATSFSLGRATPYPYIQNEANELLRIRDYLFKELAQKTGQPVEQVHKDFSRIKRFNAQEALDYGLIDRIVSPPRIKVDAPSKEAGTGLGSGYKSN